MAPSLRRLRGLFSPSPAPRFLCAGLFAFVCTMAAAPAQQPGPAVAPPPGVAPPAEALPLLPTSREPPCATPLVPVVPPKTEEAAKLVESAHCSDAVIEVIVGQSRIVIVKEDLQTPRKSATLYIGDPRIADMTFVPPTPKEPNVVVPRRAIQVVGKQVGVTDFVIQMPDDRIFKFEVRVVRDPTLLEMLNAQLRCQFPDASLRVTMVRDSFVIEGEARSATQLARILEVLRALIGEPPAEQVSAQGVGSSGPYAFTSTLTGGVKSRVINLVRVMGPQQVLLKVRVAELNRTAMREIGADFLVVDQRSPLAIGANTGNASMSATGLLTGGTFNVAAGASNIPGLTTAFGIFSRGDFEVFFSALRRNQLLKVLAEPNLVALNGQRANFLAGGQYFIPVAQTTIGAISGGVTATPVNFGVSLDFLAHILDDGVIRLTVDPEVSQPDFAVATTLVAGGSPVPGLNTRRAHTTVELKQGQTLAIAGLMQVTLDGTTNRIPGLGDLPILGTFFSNTTGTRTEKELIVLVTPYLIEPMNPDQVPPVPGDEVKEPNDLEFYLLNRIEGRTGVDFRSTTHYDDATHVVRCLLRLHQENVRGPNGYSE
jgi:pilus assembly protein CpaC